MPSPPLTGPSDARGRRSSAFVCERHAPIDARGRPALSRSAGYVLSDPRGNLGNYPWPLALDVERAPWLIPRDRTQPSLGFRRARLPYWVAHYQRGIDGVRDNLARRIKGTERHLTEIEISDH